MRLLFLIVILFLVPAAAAQEHPYSFEKAEALKPLVEWRDYGTPAFEEAIEQNKPVFLLLTAPSWCYWCQVYESEEYLFHPDMVSKLNADFIPIYVDADQRQDLTRQYLEGGWPSTTLMTPNKERLMGYSGPRPVPNMLANMDQAIGHVRQHGFSNSETLEYEPRPGSVPLTSQLLAIMNQYASFLLQVHDPVHGGFGTGQKFPQGRTLDFALDTHGRTGEQRFLTTVQVTLENQYTAIEQLDTNYNLFDPVEGGFHRYGVTREWTPPHYEKMLYDNALLLRVYDHLLEFDPENEKAKEVVEKTKAYMEREWYDPAGGFWGNTDVHGEDAYYGQNPRPLPKARVEKAKYSDWNAEAVVTYLSLWKRHGDPHDREIAEQTLHFFAREMITDQGAYHFYKDGNREVRGNILDNSFLLLAFVEGYDAFRDDRYLATARQLADYSLDTLYDWHAGGFFERNSPDVHLYALGDHVLLSKPTEENGVMAYALLKLYAFTFDDRYLIAGLRTIGDQMDDPVGLDRGYYLAKAAEVALEIDAVTAFTENEEAMLVVEAAQQERFWLNQPAIPVTGFVASEAGLQHIEGPILVLMLVALLAGFISFASPCSLPIVPAYLAYSFRSSQRNITGMTLAFFFGLSLVFTVLGMTATAVGTLLRSQVTLFSQVAGIAILAFGLYILSGRGFSGIRVTQKKPTTYLSSFAFGGVMGLSWTPCVGPILVAILLLASTASSVVTGGLLLFVYAIGLAIPLIVVSSYLGRINKEGRVWRCIEGKDLRFRVLGKQRTIHSMSLVSGILFLVLGWLIFSGALFTFNQYITSTSLQQALFGIEEALLGAAGG